MATLCPICGKDDAIQKVSAVVGAGKSTGSFAGPTAGLTYARGNVGVAGAYTMLSGSTMSDLARKLAAPPEPKPDNSSPGCMALIFLMIGGSMAGGAIIAWSLEGFWAGLAMFIMWVVPCVAAGILILSSESRRKTRVMKEYRGSRRGWLYAMSVWDRAYYCFRDDVVFDPETQKSCPPIQMKELYSVGQVQTS